MPPTTDKRRRTDPKLPTLPDSPAREAQAFAALDELARRYLGRPLAEGEVTVFVDRMDRALGTCLRGLVALHRGQEQFRAALGVRGKPGETTSTLAGEATEDPRALAASLLGPDGEQATQTLQEGCKRVLLQQMGLLSGLLAGLTDLLAKLSPASVSRHAASTSNPAETWKAYQRVHASLAHDAKETFEQVFGPHFARALAAMFGHSN